MTQNTNLNITVEAWADIVIKSWRYNIEELEIGVSNDLFNSFDFHINSLSGGKPASVEFVFEYYGRFVDMGVGKGVKALSFEYKKTKRKPKPWYSREWRFQVHRLNEILSDKYGIEGANIIKEHINKALPPEVGINY